MPIICSGELTVLCAAAKEVENVAMATDHLHHFHLLYEICQLAVCGVILVTKSQK